MDWIDYWEESRREQLKSEGCTELPAHAGRRWRLPNGTEVSEGEAWVWLERRKKEGDDAR